MALKVLVIMLGLGWGIWGMESPATILYISPESDPDLNSPLHFHLTFPSQILHL